MKKLLSIFFVAAFFTSCGGGDANDETNAPSAPVTPGIDNVNGNIPDTTGAIRLNRSLPIDSVTGTTADTAADTATRRR
jgi:hypothetical protein